MPDRYDPKLSLRPGGSRRAAEPRRDGPAGDDPLAELAKIVSGRTGGSAARARPTPAGDQGPTSTGGDVLGDLETELLNDLQASFAAVRDMVASPQPPPTAPQAAAGSPRRAAEDSHDTELPPAGLAARLAPQPPPQLFRSAPVGRIQEGEPPQDRLGPDSAPSPPIREEKPPVQPAPPARTLGDDAGLSGYQSRAGEATEARSATPSRLPRSRWETESERPASTPVSRFAPPRSPPPKAPAIEEDDGDLFADLAGAEDEEALEEFPLEGFGEIHPDDDDDEAHDVGYPEDDLAVSAEPRRSRTPMLVASVIGLVLVGGIAVAMFRPTGDEAGTPPVIVADGSPTKITPDEAMIAEADAQNKLIYDRVSPAAEGGETTLLTPAEEPIAEVPASDAGDNPISRVIIPAGPGFDDPASDDGLSLDGQPSTMPPDATQMAAAEEEPIEAIGPRRVRTVIVKPDGTIVESVASEIDRAAADTEPPAPEAAPEVAAPQPIAPPSPAPVTDDTAAIAGGEGELEITPVPEIEGTAVAETPAPAPPPAPASQPAPAAVAAVESTAPIDLGQSPPPPSGGMLVQVSSQRSEDAARATYRDLQARYPNILGPYDVNIQRAEIPDRGTFYRVRVGPFSASDAQRLCNDLKAAGGDCILAQR